MIPRCPACDRPMAWDVQRSMHEPIPTVYLLTKCCTCPGDWKRVELEVLWPPPGKPPQALP